MLFGVERMMRVSNCLFFLLFFCHSSCGNLSSLTRDQAEPPEVEAQCLNHWTTEEVPHVEGFYTEIFDLDDGCVRVQSENGNHSSYFKQRDFVQEVGFSALRLLDDQTDRTAPLL